MIITQTPLRVSFFGGGTDFPRFYLREEGCVLSTTINKYVFVIIKERFDDRIRVGYTKTELVEHVSQLEHELIREALRKAGLFKRLEISTMADIPSAGSGLGSSSAVTVGALNAIYSFLNRPREADSLARDACDIEINILKKPIGKQDQYLAAYGGLRFLRFTPEDQIKVESVLLQADSSRRFSQYMMLIYTNMTRKAEMILAEQEANIEKQRATLRRLKEFARTGRALLEEGCYEDFGRLLHESWLAKKKLASQISNSAIDAIYEKALRAGALGGKITGAGGGGFLLLWCVPELQERVISALHPLQPLPVRLEPSGSKVIFNYSRT